MTHDTLFEAIDRRLKLAFGNSQDFGNISILFAGELVCEGLMFNTEYGGRIGNTHHRYPYIDTV